MPQSAVISAAATTKSAVAKAAASDDGSSSEDEKSQPNKMNGKTGTPSKVDRWVVHLYTVLLEFVSFKFHKAQLLGSRVW